MPASTKHFQLLLLREEPRRIPLLKQLPFCLQVELLSDLVLKLQDFVRSSDNFLVLIKERFFLWSSAVRNRKILLCPDELVDYLSGLFGHFPHR